MAYSFILLGIAGSSTAGAQLTIQAPSQTEAPSATASPAADVAPAPAEGSFDAAPVGDVALQAIAGREGTSLIAQADQVATSANNGVGDDSRTGDINISDAAFQNASGLTLLNINSGNNVAINASMNVNIVINPPAPQ
jgi:hypothetical protein